MTEIFLDIETTGLSFQDNHKIVEIACIETNELIPTKKVFHKIINPERDVPNEAFKIHGFSTAYLKDKPKFIEIADELLSFINGNDLIIHNMRNNDYLMIKGSNATGLNKYVNQLKGSKGVL